MRSRFWENIYKQDDVANLPWFSPLLDNEVREYLEKINSHTGSFLDLGTGLGTQGIELARLGYDVTATDISPTAIQKAEERARREGVSITFLVDNILKTRLPPDSFNFLYDRGVFHTMEPRQRKKFVRTIRRLIKKDGRYFLKAFSTRTPGTWGPYRFTEEDIVRYFSPLFEILSINHSIYPGTLEEAPRTLFCVMRPK